MLAIFILVGIVAAISLYDYFTTRGWQAVTSPVRNDAVFEKRNQNYGAYKIRRDYNRNFILILVGLIGGVGVIYGAASAFREPAKKMVQARPDVMDTTLLTLNDDEKLPEIELPEVELATAPPVQEMIEFREVKVSDIDPKDPITPPDPGKVIGTQSQTGTDPFGKPIFVDPNLPPGTGDPVKKKDDDENKIYKTGLTEVAEFVGGAPERIKFMKSNFRYPDSAVEGEKEGKVYINFIVRKNGNVEEEMIVKKLKGCPECDAEALRVVKKMPPWNPGKINGRPVDSYFNLPVTFQLAKE